MNIALNHHIPVMREAVIAAMNISGDDWVVDATYGGGGHAHAILAELGGGGKFLVIDRDPEAIALAKEKLGDDARVQIIHAKFSQLGEILKARGWCGRVQAILFDFGVSSPQLDSPARGFGFTNVGPLDMRMDQSSGIAAHQWLRKVSAAELARVLREFGEERFAKRVATAIKSSLAQLPVAQIPTTADLASWVAAAIPSRERNKHPATRTFQAIRIFINRELDEVREVLPQAVAGLAQGGRLVVLSFHSLEDRLVKRFLRERAHGDPYPPELPISENMKQPTMKLVGRAQRASTDEVSKNRRARSAVLRVGEKLPTRMH